MSAATPLFSPTLESVQQAFDQWRATRPKRSQTPISLQHRAAALLDSHPASHICSALKINDTALKRWAGQSSKKLIPRPVADAPFIELPISPDTEQTSQPDTHCHSLSIELSDGLRLSINAHFTLEHILSIAQRHKQGVQS